MFNDTFKNEVLSKLNNVEGNQDIVGNVIDGISMNNVNKLIRKNDTVMLGYGTPLMFAGIVFIATMFGYFALMQRFNGGDPITSVFMFFVILGIVLGFVTYFVVQSITARVFRNQIDDDRLHDKYAKITTPTVNEHEAKYADLMKRYQDMGGE